MIQLNRTDSLKKLLAMLNFESICLIFSLLHLNKVCMKTKFDNTFKTDLFFFSKAIKESCDWFVQNYDVARK